MDRIDFAALDTRKGAEAGFDLQLLDVSTRRPLPGFVLRIRGYDSETYQNKALEQQRLRLERRRDGKVPTEADLKNDALELAAALVISWPEGAMVDGSAATAVSIVAVPAIREQVEAGAADRGNFLPGSAKSS